MELGLSLGDASKTFGTFMEKSHDHHHHHHVTNKSLGFCMGLSIGPNVNNTKETDQQDEDQDDDDEELKKHKSPEAESPIVQLDLLPNTPVQRNPSSTVQLLAFPWGQIGGGGGGGGRGFDVNKLPLVVDHQAETDQDGASSSPNNSAASSFQTDFCIYNNNNNNNNKRDFDSSGSGALGNHDLEAERASSRNSDDDENGCTRKKLRLSKDQSAFLEESFKEHNTLNPKQKLALAKQLNLRPRQVEVWFQNRRARTKLKQTEVDCEYLKRCCETLTEENRRLHKELQELRALKSSNPFYMQLPATTLTMCPSCERVATTTTNPPTTTTTAVATTTHSTDPTSNKGSGRPRFYPFSHNQNRGHQSTTSTSEK